MLDITCGSGTTAMVAEQWGRRWITCDTSRVALTLAKQRLMTCVFDYYQLAHPDEGVGSGFLYKEVPHITLKSIANNEPPEPEKLYDQPISDSKKARVCGPFTVEAVPAPVVGVISAGDEDKETPRPGDGETLPAGTHLARGGETLRQDEWRSELLRTGIRGKNGQFLQFSRVEPLPGTRWLHAEAETRAADKSALVPDEMFAPKRVVVSFGPAHAPLEQRQVEQALEEARHLMPKPGIIVFAAFQFDPEAATDLDETRWPVETDARGDLIKKLHERKTAIFMELLDGGGMVLRPGVARLVDEAIAAGIPIAVCSTSADRAVNAVVSGKLGSERAKKIKVFAGDIVKRKKPDPEIYNLAARILAVEPKKCVVIEDSQNGLEAAKAAGMNCIVTISSYTGGEDFRLADRVVADLDSGIDLAACQSVAQSRA